MTVEVQNTRSIVSEYQFNQDFRVNSNQISSEITKLKPSKIEELESPYKMKEIKDEFIHSKDVSFEERLKQVISHEEMKQILSLAIRTTGNTGSQKGQNVDVLG
jgi:uncharacterized protein YprB with RNaseH-like and TPR domain